MKNVVMLEAVTHTENSRRIKIIAIDLKSKKNLFIL